MELGDYHAAKTCLLAAGLLNQFRVTSYQEIFDFVDQKNSSDEQYEEQLSKTLPLCFDAYEATKTPESMKIFLKELKSEGKIEELHVKYIHEEVSGCPPGHESQPLGVI